VSGTLNNAFLKFKKYLEGPLIAQGIMIRIMYIAGLICEKVFTSLLDQALAGEALRDVKRI
jgi:divalent metal cation (Fe/Co/Zn/Cd) transporter